MEIEIPNFNQARVLIVGDVMLDRYWQGPVSRISPEAPVPIVRVKEIEERPGGAGNVALNVVALGGQVTLLGIAGQDDAAKQLEGQLTAIGVKCCFVKMQGIRTITKLRVLSQHQQLLRLDFEDEFQWPQVKQLLEIFDQELKKVDMVVLSDYDKGTLKHSQQLIEKAKQAGKIICVDPKQIDFNVYRGVDVITPNFKEFQAVVGICHDEKEIISKAEKLLRDYEIKSILVTRGEQGMTLIRLDESPLHVPAQTKEVYDVTGAGDTVIAALAATLAVKKDLAHAVQIANIAAGITVTKLGAATVSVPELMQVIHGVHTGNILNEEQLLLIVKQLRAEGKKIVMTNGCFDILHAGHVHYLNQAKKFGDCLIVAVNSDLSVKKLKGKNRPINKLEERMSVLSSLGSVNWVVPFSEDTPERLVRKIAPDVMVKGGDYQSPKEIAGAEFVLKNGGEVQILPFVKGCSTTEVIKRVYAEEEI